MALGARLRKDGDIEWGEYLFSSFPEISDEGLPRGVAYSEDTRLTGFGLPEPRDVSIERDGDGRANGEVQVYDGRSLAIERLVVVGRPALIDLRDAMLRRSGITQLAFQGLGPAGTGVQMLAYVHSPRLVYDETEDLFVHGMAEVDIEWSCDDPRFYSLVERSVTVSSSNPVVPNDGNAEAPYRLVVAGECENPRWRRMDDPTNLVVGFGGYTVPTGRSMSYSVREEDFFLDDGTDVGFYAHDNEDRPAPLWGIPPGGVEFGFASDGGTPTATVYVRDTFW